MNDLEVLYYDVRGSFALAMKVEGLTDATIDHILTTVDDYVGNHDLLEPAE